MDKADGDEGDFTSDLVTVSREVGEKDFFTRWLSDELLEPFHNLIGYRWKVNSVLSNQILVPCVTEHANTPNSVTSMRKAARSSNTETSTSELCHISSV